MFLFLTVITEKEYVKETYGPAYPHSTAKIRICNISRLSEQ